MHELTHEFIGDLRGWTRRSIDVAEKALDEIALEESNHLGFMATLFLCKQVEHARSIILLVPRKDVVLIARSMVEGLCQLIWARQKEDRAFRWRSFAYVHDWRLMRLKAARGEHFDAGLLERTEEALRHLGEAFLTDEARRAKESGRPLPPDPYQKHWRAGFNLRQFCEGEDVAGLYTEAYDPFSDWHHWGVGGLGGAIQRVNGRIRYNRESLNDSAASLTAAFQCVLQTTQVADVCLCLGVSQQLAELRSEFLAFHGQISKGDCDD